MKYQRVLYTTRLTAKIRSRLRIISFKKRPSLKRNVYLVGFASVADAKTADRCAKRLFNVTLKPIQSLPSDTQCVNQLDLCSFQQNLLQSAPKSAAPFSSPTAPVSFLPYFESTLIASGASPTRVGETLEERAARILGSCVAAQRDVASHPFVESMSSVGLHHRVNPTANNMAVCGKDRRRVIDEVRSCLTTMQLAHQASDRVYELHSRVCETSCTRENVSCVHIRTRLGLSRSNGQPIQSAFNGVLCESDCLCPDKKRYLHRHTSVLVRCCYSYQLIGRRYTSSTIVHGSNSVSSSPFVENRQRNIDRNVVETGIPASEAITLTSCFFFVLI